MIHSHKTPEIFPIVTPGYLYNNPYGTGHGSPYDYDTHVPLIFARDHFQSKTMNEAHATVDIAPTIAKIIGVKIPEFCDGKPIEF
jgi:arylsulfatase A-like enzyme